MKKQLFIASFIAAILSCSSAWALDFSLGIKAGGGVSNMFGTAIADTDNLLAAHGGESGFLPSLTASVFLDVKYSKYFGAEIGAEIVTRGRKEKSDDLNLDDRLHAGYIEAPLFFSAELPLRAFTPFVYAGPVFGYLLYADRYDVIADTTMDQFEGRKTFDFSLAGGGGVTIPAGIGSVVIDIRYTMGLSTIDKVTDEEKTVDPRAKSLDIKFWNAVVTAGYAFKL
jgi:hypothetical protein